MDLLLELADAYTFVNFDSAGALLDECLRLAARHNNNARAGDAYALRGTSFFRIDGYDSALFYYAMAESYYEKDTSAQREVNIAANRMSMGTALLQQGNQQTALTYYLRAIEPLRKAKDDNNLVTAFANIGLVYNDLKQYDKALQYHRQALHTCLSARSEIANEKTAQVQMLVALDQSNLKQYDDAYAALQRADSMIRLTPSPYLYAIFYGMEGRYYKDVNEYHKAIQSFQECLGYAANGEYLFQQANALQQLGIIYFEQGDYHKSISNLLHAVSISRQIGDKMRERKTLEYLSKAYASARNDAEAVKYYQQYIALNDSLNEAETSKRVNEIENRYQHKQQADSILVLQKNGELQKLALHKEESRNVFVIIAAALILLVGLLLYRTLRNKHRLLKQSDELHTRQILQLEQERQLIAAQSLMKGQEEERSRMARDLHDGVGGLLSGVKLSLSNMKGNVFLSEENARAVNTIISQLDSSITELRRVSHNMMPEALIKYGLKEALENYCEGIDRSGQLNIRLQTYGLEQRMEQDSEIVLYRIVQELLNNVIKHADAKQVLIQLVREADRFSLTVEDDGKGFDVQSSDYKIGAGLQNIQARAVYLNGGVDIRTVPGEGTSITIEGTLN